MLELKHISKRFQEQLILNDISLIFNDTGFVGIQGESGCGKSTLLYIIGMLDDSFEGELSYNNERIIDREKYIREHISYMMQNKDTIDALTVRENILLSSIVAQRDYQDIEFQKITNQLEISSLLDVYPNQLSGGQLKRVSIAKALLKHSSIILCDEPTGALHQKQAHEVMSLLKKVSQNSLVIMVSHDKKLLKQYCDTVLTLNHGKIQDHYKKGRLKTIEIPKKHYHSLWFCTMRQIIHQRNKLIFLFIFQWLVIASFFLIVTAMNGIFDAIKESEMSSVNVNLMTIEKKNGEIFDSYLNHQFISQTDYVYQLDQIVVKSNAQSISALVQFLPTQTSHIQLKEGHIPKTTYEVIVSDALYKRLKNKQSLFFTFQEKQIEMKIVGVVQPYFFQNQEIYCSRSLQDELSTLKNQYTLLIETKAGKSRQLYHELNASYRVYSENIERIDNYQSLLSLGSMVANVFIGISFVISLLLIAIVESTIYFERKHDVAYLLSLGLPKRKLFLLSLSESMMLGIIMASGGSLFSQLIYYYLNQIYSLIDHFSFELVIKPIVFSEFDLYILIFISYMLMTVLAALASILKMMKTNMIDVLREE